MDVQKAIAPSALNADFQNITSVVDPAQSISFADNQLDTTSTVNAVQNAVAVTVDTVKNAAVPMTDNLLPISNDSSAAIIPVGPNTVNQVVSPTRTQPKPIPTID